MSEAAPQLPNDDPNPDAPKAEEVQPGWLVSSDQGAEDELEARADEKIPSPFRLDTSHDLSEAHHITRPVAPTRPGEAPRKPARSSGPVRWTAASSSVPRLQVVPPPAAAAAAAPPFTGPPPLAARGRAIEPEEDEDARGSEEFPDDPIEAAPAAFVARHQKLDEPIWVIALDALRSNGKLQLLLLAGLIVTLGAWIFWPRSEPGISLHTLKREAAQRDGQVVRVDGRVGEVFQVGGGYAFNLHQGRDTIVVFTRGASPRERDQVSVVGSVSTGYLDGMPRLALFEQPGTR